MDSQVHFYILVQYLIESRSAAADPRGYKRQRRCDPKTASPVVAEVVRLQCSVRGSCCLPTNSATRRVLRLLGSGTAERVLLSIPELAHRSGSRSGKVSPTFPGGLFQTNRDAGRFSRKPPSPPPPCGGGRFCPAFAGQNRVGASPSAPETAAHSISHRCWRDRITPRPDRWLLDAANSPTSPPRGLQG